MKTQKKITFFSICGSILHTFIAALLFPLMASPIYLLVMGDKVENFIFQIVLSGKVMEIVREVFRQAESYIFDT